MDDYDWAFAIGGLGDPLADVKDWMLPPYPKYMPEWVREGRLHPLLERLENDG